MFSVISLFLNLGQYVKVEQYEVNMISWQRFVFWKLLFKVEIFYLDKISFASVPVWA